METGHPALLPGSQLAALLVHFLRNLLAHVPHQEKASCAAQLKQIWQQPSLKLARRYAQLLIAQYRDRFPQAITLWEEGLEDSRQFLAFPLLDERKTASTNPWERVCQEIRRRTRVVGIFPNTESYLCWVTSYLIEYPEDWMSGKKYISPPAIAQQRMTLPQAA